MLAIVNKLNARFIRGRASDSFDQAGVLIHQFDSFRANSAWEPSDKAPRTDRVSACLVNRHLPYVFSKSAGGFVIRAEPRMVNCLWYRDGATDSRTCEPTGRSACIPGCDECNYKVHGVCWGQKRCSGDGGSRWCPWESNQLRLMLKQQERNLGCDNYCLQDNCCRYNEVVLDAFSWKEALPSVIEAIFFIAGSGQENEEYARGVHRDFEDKYPTYSVPLVSFDIDGDGIPFKPQA